MKAKVGWYWKHNGNKYNIIISTPIISHPCLGVSVIKDAA